MQPSLPLLRSHISKESLRDTESKNEDPGKKSHKQTSSRETRASAFLNKFRKDVAVEKLPSVQGNNSTSSVYI